MKCTKVRYILSFAATFGILICYCSFDGLSGGTTTETTNGCVVGSLETIDGYPASQTIVKLIESTYDPVKDGPFPDSLVDTTGEAGEFGFRIAGGGTYNIEGVQSSSGEGILLSGVMVKDNDTTIISPKAIRKLGSIKILFTPESDAEGAYVYIRGTTMYAMLDDTPGFVLLESVPAGITPSLFYVVTGSAAGPKTIADSVSVAPGATTVIGYQTGAHSAKLVLNTTASGAGIANTVTNFPVLIRLGEGNFVFSQAKADGGDLRFTKSNGIPLPYEIERWDPAAREAEVWVKVDTVYGNDSTHSIMMFWGASTGSATPSLSNGVAVFDTANGFQGVWHLNRTCDDVTYGRNNGTNYGSADTTGIIGDCKKFDGSDSIKMAGLLGTPASITMSVWAQLDTVPGGGYGGEVLSIGDAVLMRMDYSVLGLGTYGAIHPYGDSVYYNVTSGQFLKQTGWHLITFTVDENNHSQTLYIDGSAVRSGDSVISIDYSRVGQNTFIGTHGNGTAGYNFSGRIDEVRVYRKSISADYVKLSFMNQKEQDALVKFK